mgnify:CR=1 FL=1
MAHYDLKTEELKEMAPRLRAGDTVSLTGIVYTARDAAHKKIVAAMDAGEKLPFDLDGAAIYYAGRSSARSARRPPVAWTRSRPVCSTQACPA